MKTVKSFQRYEAARYIEPMESIVLFDEILKSIARLGEEQGLTLLHVFHSPLRVLR